MEPKICLLVVLFGFVRSMTGQNPQIPPMIYMGDKQERCQGAKLVEFNIACANGNVNGCANYKKELNWVAENCQGSQLNTESTDGSSTDDSKRFKISIQRISLTKDCILGYLSLAGEPICYSIELLPPRGNISSSLYIPNGFYSANIRTDGSQGWTIELMNAYNRKNIQIHLGNYNSQIQGCTLLGMEADINNCTVLQSSVAMNKLSNAFKKFASDLWLQPNNRYDIQVEYK